MKTSKIDIASIHHIERARLDRQMIENGDIVGFPVGNPHESGNVAAQIQERVQLHRPFATTKPRPREQAQAEVDRGAVEGIDGLFQLHAEGLVGVELPRSTDQHLSEIGEDAPVVDAVGIGQRAPRDVAAEARMVELGLEGPQTRLDVAQAFAEGQLCERQAEELVPTREAAWATVAAVPPHARVEIVPGHEVHELSEHELPRVHASSSTAWDASPRVDSDDPSRYRERSFIEIIYLDIETCGKFQNRYDLQW